MRLKKSDHSNNGPRWKERRRINCYLPIEAFNYVKSVSTILNCSMTFSIVSIISDHMARNGINPDFKLETGHDDWYIDPTDETHPDYKKTDVEEL